MNSYQKSNGVKLKAHKLQKTFGDLLVVDNVSLELNEKDFVSMIGPSGSGKSTIFNIIAGLLAPDAGSVTIDGKDYTGRTGRVSYMYQKDLLLPWRKVIDNACLPLVINGLSWPEARLQVKAFFKVFGLEGFEYKYPSQLSGGMRQRAALMRTYMFSKDILLLDEPFGGLDAITRSKMHYWLLNVLENLTASVFFITHDIEEAIFLSDKIYVLTDRPAKVKEKVVIDLPKPRHKDLVTSAKFNEIKRHIIDLL